MKRLHIFLLAIAAMAFLAAGCVKNDLPYPTVVAEITAFEVSGQTSCNIDRTNRTVAVVVPSPATSFVLEETSFNN